MKVLLVNKFHFRKGGSETYYLALAELLKSMGHQVVFFAMQSDQNEPCEQSQYFVNNVDYNGRQSVFRQVQSAAKLLYSLEAKEKFRKLVLAEKPDIVHLNLVHRQITLSIVDVCSEYHIPVVFTQHDLICVCPNYTCLSPDGICEDCIGGSFLNCIRKSCIKNSKAKSIIGTAEAEFYTLRKTYNKINCYICPSEFYRTILLKSKFTDSDIIHLAKFLPLGTDFQMKSNINNHLLFLGRLSREKGIETLIKAVSLVKNVHLDIAGDGPLRAELEALIQELNLMDRVHLHGFVKGQALSQLRSDCRSLVLPSEWYENGPYSVMEALSDGKPVIGSDIGGIPEMVHNGLNGFTFTAGSVEGLAEAIQKLYALSESEYFNMCSNAVSFAESNFKAETYGEKILNLYNHFI